MSSSTSPSSSNRKPQSRGPRGRRRGKPNSSSASSDRATMNPDDVTMSEEEVMIAFAPYMREENAEAVKIHDEYQSDQRAFVRAAREFLETVADASTPETTEEAPTIPDTPLDATLNESTPNETAVSTEEEIISSLPAGLLSSINDPEPTTTAITQETNISSPPPSLSQPTATTPLETQMHGLTIKEDPVFPMIAQSPPRNLINSALPSGLLASPISPPPPAAAATMLAPSSNLIPATTPEVQTTTPITTPTLPPEEPTKTTPATTTTPKPRPPKRLWCRAEEQPGRVLANNVPYGRLITIRPRQELTAQWVLPLQYLQNKQYRSLQEALHELYVGLFRRGCTDNTNSIISKQVIQHPHEVRGDVIVGTVPFFTPRTPGNVLLRMYLRDDAIYTLATGATLEVKVDKHHVESTLKFLLTNFKKNAVTSLSSIHSLVTLLQEFDVVSSPRTKWERAMWGCLCEARRVLEGCARDYLKTKDKVSKMEAEVEELKDQQESDSDDDPELADKIKDKTSSYMSTRNSNERKWRDTQLAFASMLKALSSNPYCSVLVTPEVLTTVRLELELWCPLCETFAPSPFNTNKYLIYADAADFPNPINPSHFKKCADARAKMQMDSLGFVPSLKSLERALTPRNSQGSNQNSMNPVAVSAFNRMSAAMGELYQREYLVSERIHKQRELVRAHVESFVSRCSAFPVGTRVVVFGSSANGFGSPSSDLDMCLQLPPNTKLADEDDPAGSKAMAKLAELLEQGGMKEVNTERLTARIPIVMFSCPRPLAADGENPMVECDISMQNPLACLNTSLLLTYSQIHPVTRVLASIIKRWAKSRDINNPSDHTLSTYGYILMLLHFLTYHRRTGTGLVTTIDKRDDRQQSLVPLLPNLQWMDPAWPESPSGTPYRELGAKPKQLMVHPLQHKDFIVNTYFYRLNDAASLARLQQRFPGQDLSLSIMLASFFRYYAYEFDYKRYVVSLNSTATRGLVEREVKAETDCWRVFGVSLSIEDPFETFYDVAHVLKGSNYHRIRNEFALAYTKIVMAAAGNFEKDAGNDLLDWICEPYVKPEQD